MKNYTVTNWSAKEKKRKILETYNPPRPNNEEIQSEISLDQLPIRRLNQ